MIVLEDGEMAVVTRDSVQVMRVDGTPVTREPMEVTWDESVCGEGRLPALHAEGDSRRAAAPCAIPCAAGFRLTVWWRFPT
ncbi:MAG: hypothetical protein RML56_01105 [Burkholderiales bacterium]|nr:hypothetical protein [Burkholderiales bacterium]